MLVQLSLPLLNDLREVFERDLAELELVNELR